MPNNPTSSPAAANNGNKSRRRKLYKLHSWVGFHLAFIMALVLATGTMATLSNEIDWLVYKEIRVTPGEQKVSWQTMTDAVKDYAPESQIISIISLQEDYLAYRANVKDNNDRRYYIYINQWTGKVNGETPLVTVQRVFRDLHRYLFMPNFIGLPIVSSMAVILLISLYTGLKTSRNWRTLMTRVRVKKGLRVLIGDAHKAAGLWSLWFILLVAITGIWYFAEFAGLMTSRITNNSDYSFQSARPEVSPERLTLIGRTITPAKTSDIIRVAESAFPELDNKITEVYFPIKPEQSIRVAGQRSYSILRPRANQVFIDPENLNVIKVQRSEEIGPVSWLNNLVDPLHFGTFGGLISKVVWFLFGLALTGLSVTGVVLTWKRLKSKSVSSTQLKTLPVLFTTLLACYFFWYPLFQAPSKSHSEQSYTQLLANDFHLKLHVGINKQDTPDGKIRLLVDAKNGIANIKKASIELYENDEIIGQAFTFKLRKFSQTSLYSRNIPMESFKTAQKIKVNIELHNNDVITADWSLD